MSEDALEKLREMLDKVAAVKMPEIIRRGRPSEVVDGEFVPLSAREKIDQLESYLLLTAEARQLADSARLAASDALFETERELRGLEGWEMYLTGSRSKATGAQVMDALRKASPALMGRRDRLDWLVKRFTEQISRLEKDDAATSRAYTFITGGG